MRNTFKYIRINGTTGIAVWDNEDQQSCKNALHTLFDNVVSLETLRKLNFGSLNIDDEFNEYFKQPD